MRPEHAVPAHELPPDKHRVMQQALRLEKISLIYFATAIGFTAAVMGQSQAMKTAWVDDLLGFVPPIAVLIACRLRTREATEEFPYGYHRSVTIAFLVNAVALLGLGLALVIDGVGTLIRGERPTIGGVHILGHDIWLGWLMLAALLWSAVPTVFLGRIKLRLARTLHDKALFADAAMNRADWLTAAAAIVGVIGVGLGYWWADSVAAIVIALDIVHDGVANLRTVVADLMDSRPRTVEGRPDPLPGELERALERLPWVLDASVRMRESGHIYLGEAFIRPLDEHDPVARIREARALARSLDWRLHDLTVQLVDGRDDDADVRPPPT